MGNALKVVAKVCVGEPFPPREGAEEEEAEHAGRVGTGQLAGMRNYFLTFLFGGEGGLEFLRHYGIALLASPI